MMVIMTKYCMHTVRDLLPNVELSCRLNLVIGSGGLDPTQGSHVDEQLGDSIGKLLV